MTKVWLGIILLTLLVVMAWAGFNKQRMTLVIDVTVEPVSPIVVPVTPEPEGNPLLAVTPRISSDFLPTVTPRPLNKSVLLPSVGR